MVLPINVYYCNNRESLSESANVHMYMFMNHYRHSEQSNTDMMITGLEVIANLCRQNPSVQIFLKGMVSVLMIMLHVCNMQSCIQL